MLLNLEFLFGRATQRVSVRKPSRCRCSSLRSWSTPDCAHFAEMTSFHIYHTLVSQALRPVAGTCKSEPQRKAPSQKHKHNCSAQYFCCLTTVPKYNALYRRAQSSQCNQTPQILSTRASLPQTNSSSPCLLLITYRILCCGINSSSVLSFTQSTTLISHIPSNRSR
jgi:hypothetical protein